MATNEFNSLAHFGQYRFNLETGAWSLDVHKTLSYWERLTSQDPFWHFDPPEAYLLEQQGVGVITFMSFILSIPIMKSATRLQVWLDDHYPDENPHNGLASTELNTLYGIELLEQSQEDDPVLLSFGEQAAYASRYLIPHFICLGIKTGASIDKVNLSQLKGHTVYIWPDHGDAGEKLAKTVANRLFKLDRQAEISILKPLMYLPECERGWKFKVREVKLPVGYNATDVVAAGWSSNDFCEVLGKLCRWVAYKFVDYEVGNYWVKEDGVYQVTYKDGEEYQNKISSRIEVVAMTRDTYNKNWGLQLQFEDHDGNLHEWAMPKEMLAGGGDAYREILLARGADIYSGSGNKDKLTQYFLDAKPTTRSLCVSNIGWSRNVFVLPEKTYGQSNERVILQTANAKKAPPFCIKGTLTQWQNNVGVLCIGNSRIILAVCVALTGHSLMP